MLNALEFTLVGTMSCIHDLACHTFEPISCKPAYLQAASCHTPPFENTTCILHLSLSAISLYAVVLHRHVRQKLWQVQRLRCSVTREPWAAKICTWRTSLSAMAARSSSRYVVTPFYILPLLFMFTQMSVFLLITISCVMTSAYYQALPVYTLLQLVLFAH